MKINTFPVVYNGIVHEKNSSHKKLKTMLFTGMGHLTRKVLWALLEKVMRTWHDLQGPGAALPSNPTVQDWKGVLLSIASRWKRAVNSKFSSGQRSSIDVVVMKNNTQDGEMAHLIKYLPGKHEDPGSIPSTNIRKLAIAACVYNPSTVGLAWQT